MFLKKIGLSLGVAFSPLVGFGKGNLFRIKSSTNQIFHLSPKVLRGEFRSSFNNLQSSLILVSDNNYVTKSELFEEIRSDAVLFTKKHLNLSDSINKDLPLVNSNFSQKPDFVSDFLISNKTGKRIGILGIAFGEVGQTISGTIRKVNDQAKFLRKVKNCELVYCLMENPNSNDSVFTLRDLAEKSDEVDQFFASSSEIKGPQLYCLKNKGGRQIFLNVQSETVPEQGIVNLKNGEFSGFNVF
ncbi:hypothetical protein ALPR1_10670 [Algoriphagus machipongonensis]|uniref:Uncharacterized protein n=2 Tax=Algoriphagus machipongonensis TaxID=388413 RepID=A3HS55_9BACT|nr:hypothetical protein ALPR1_10670 [Algoriphagus machipongonensis]